MANGARHFRAFGNDRAENLGASPLSCVGYFNLYYSNYNLIHRKSLPSLLSYSQMKRMMSIKIK